MLTNSPPLATKKSKTPADSRHSLTLKHTTKKQSVYCSFIPPIPKRILMYSKIINYSTKNICSAVCLDRCIEHALSFFLYKFLLVSSKRAEYYIKKKHRTLQRTHKNNMLSSV